MLILGDRPEAGSSLTKTFTCRDWESLLTFGLGQFFWVRLLPSLFSIQKDFLQSDKFKRPLEGGCVGGASNASSTWEADAEEGSGVLAPGQPEL